MYNLHSLQQHHNYQLIIPQDPYELTEEWVTCPYKEMKEDGCPSPVYSVSDKKYRMLIFPKGYKEYKGKCLALFIMCPKIQEEHKVSLKIETKNGKKTAVRETDFNFSKVQTNRGFKDFINLNEINDYLDGDHLVLKLTVKFNTPIFRKIVFSIDTSDVEDTKKSVPLNLQRLFALMQMSPIAPETTELTKSFGWGTMDVFMQHDVQEFLRELIDNLETKMKGTENEKAISSVFCGKTKNYVKCKDNDEISSEHLEDFYDIQLVVKNMNNLQKSIEQTVEDNYLTGDNQYEFEGIGKHDAIKGCKYDVLPPIIHFHLQRFEYDLMTGMMKKVNDYFEFPYEIDMSPYLSDTADKSGSYVYQLISVLVHQGEQYGGHYYAYCRTSPERKWILFNDNELKIVEEDEVIKNNFGGNNKNYSAYFLAYARKSEINKIMSPIDNSEIPHHVLDYYNECKCLHSGQGPSITLRLVTESDYKNHISKNDCINSIPDTDKKISGVPVDYKFKDILNKIKESVEIKSNSISLWRINQKGIPYDRINQLSQIKSVFKTSSKLLVVESPEQTEGEIPFIILYFDPNRPSSHLSFIKFSVLKPSDNLHKVLLQPIFSQFSTTDEKIIIYYYSNGKTVKLDEDKTVSEQNLQRGIIIFQKDSFNNEPFKLEKMDVYKYIDLLPEYRTNTVDKYFDALSNSITISVISRNDPQDLSKINVKSTMPIKTFIRCIKVLHNIPETDSILLFENKESNHPIKTNISINVQQIVTQNTIYYQVMKNIDQNELEKKSFFSLSIFDENLKLIQSVSLLMNPNFTVKDVINKIKERKLISDNKPFSESK